MTTVSVLINDIIVPTADPRIPFGGRKSSGFGVTRGAEGLLEMTTPQTISVQRSKRPRHYDPTTASHSKLFSGLILATHAESWTKRWRGLRQLVLAARRIGADATTAPRDKT
jgi:hypothetical protein